MSTVLNIAFFGSSLVSTYWNGAATYYRGIVRALHGRGHRITFYEPDAWDRQKHRDIPDPDWAQVVVYAGIGGVLRALEQASTADLVVKASGVGMFDELLEREVIELRRPHTLVAFWDMDAPATLDRLAANADDPFLSLIPRFDLIFTYGGGPRVIRGYKALGAGACVPIYNAVDPESHHPVPPDSRFEADLSFLGNRLPDRERRIEGFFLQPAGRLPERRFLLGGRGWGDRSLPDNVRGVGHVSTAWHNAFNCTPLAVLNVNRESMATCGYSPPTRIFEAAGAGACVITDAWEGISLFLDPGREVIVARSGGDVVDALAALTKERACEIGRNALRRVLAEHTYARRAAQVEIVLEGRETRTAGARA